MQRERVIGEYTVQRITYTFESLIKKKQSKQSHNSNQFRKGITFLPIHKREKIGQPRKVTPLIAIYCEGGRARDLGVSLGAGTRNRWSAESVAEYRPISRPMIGACKPKRWRRWRTNDRRPPWTGRDRVPATYRPLCLLPPLYNTIPHAHVHTGERGGHARAQAWRGGPPSRAPSNIRVDGYRPD